MARPRTTIKLSRRLYRGPHGGRHSGIDHDWRCDARCKHGHADQLRTNRRRGRGQHLPAPHTTCNRARRSTSQALAEAPSTVATASSPSHPRQQARHSRRNNKWPSCPTKTTRPVHRQPVVHAITMLTFPWEPTAATTPSTILDLPLDRRRMIFAGRCRAGQFHLMVGLRIPPRPHSLLRSGRRHRGARNASIFSQHHCVGGGISTAAAPNAASTTAT